MKLIPSWVEASQEYKAKKAKSAIVWIMDKNKAKSKDKAHGQDIVVQETDKKMSMWVQLQGVGANIENETELKTSSYARARSLGGQIFRKLDAFKPDSIQFHFQIEEREQILGFLVGLDLAAYRFKVVFTGDKKTVPYAQYLIQKKKLDPKWMTEAAEIARSVNNARHMVNLGPNWMTPEIFCETAEKLVASKNVKIEVWDEKRLAKEGLRLLLAVGQASENPPRLFKAHYRPTKAGSEAPVVLVGKGVTFDSGGLDIKPSSGMRLMKKDMGGAATVLSVLMWAVRTKYPYPLDVYCALAENSIGSKSFRPGDVIQSRSGKWIEIHNTDAEGRLVLVDAFDVALENAKEPRALINVATLTGAIKVAIGGGMAGLFSNREDLSRDLISAAQQSGDLCWRMPLFQKYRSSMNSNFADMTNATDGFGGAVTAALFLESFVQKQPWAHFDVYAWSDGSDGALSESGGNGQSVQNLIFYLNNLKSRV